MGSNPAGSMDVCVVCCTGRTKRQKTKKRVRIEYKKRKRKFKKSHWGRNFPHPSTPPLGSNQPPIQWLPAHSRGVKGAGRGVIHPPSPSAEVKERVELYLYSHSGFSLSVLWSTLPLTLYDIHFYDAYVQKGV